MENQENKRKIDEFVRIFIDITISFWWVPVLGMIYVLMSYLFIVEKPLIDYVLYNAVPGTLILAFLLPLGLAVIEIWDRSKKK